MPSRSATVCAPGAVRGREGEVIQGLGRQTREHSIPGTVSSNPRTTDTGTGSQINRLPRCLPKISGHLRGPTAGGIGQHGRLARGTVEDAQCVHHLWQ